MVEKEKRMMNSERPALRRREKKGKGKEELELEGN